MKKITIMLFSFFALGVLAQQKSTGTIILDNPNIPITANFTLDNTTSKVTLIFTGPSDRWFGMGIGVEAGYSMASGDALVFTTNTTPNLTDRNFTGIQEPPLDASQNWTTVSNEVNGDVRTLTLTRDLVTGDNKDFQMPYATTNAISISCVRPSGTTFNVGQHGGTSNVGYASGVAFTTLGVEDFSLSASTVYPNPSNGNFTVKTKTGIEKINVYSQTGAFIKTINIDGDSPDVEVKLNGLQTGVYLIELQNSSEKSWKKIIIN